MGGVFYEKILENPGLLSAGIDFSVCRQYFPGSAEDVQDQTLKLQIRDAVIGYLSDGISGLPGVEEAKEYLMGELDNLKKIANQVIRDGGFDYSVKITLDREAFDTRVYDTFTLPAGVYDSLRIVIGPGEGRNWWCVVFPRLCLPQNTQQVQSAAAGAGFSDALTGSITRQEEYEVRFWILDCLGKIQNFFFMG